MSGKTDFNDLSLLIKTGTPIITIETHEETRVLELLAEIAAYLNKPLFAWDHIDGMKRSDLSHDLAEIENTQAPLDALAQIKASQRGCLFAMCDFHPHFEDAPKIVRQLKEIAQNSHITTVDKAVMLADNLLKTLLGGYQVTGRANPAETHHSTGSETLTPEQEKHSAGLMRINHCGEVCAQALYQGQAMTAKLPEVRQKMELAAAEENDHLQWCAGRLKQLDSHTSVLNPLWYAGSFTIGAIAGVIGDKWSLGFVAETEHQVVRHLDSHLAQLPDEDIESRAILTQMREDELHHATSALAAGGAELPRPVRSLMGLMSKVMTSSVYYI